MTQIIHTIHTTSKQHKLEITKNEQNLEVLLHGQTGETSTDWFHAANLGFRWQMQEHQMVHGPGPRLLRRRRELGRNILAERAVLLTG